MSKFEELSCPIPITRYKKILLAHGGGGKLTQDLIDQIFFPCFKNPILEPLTDSAVLNIGNGKIAFTTDSYVVSPIFFPGGNIGELAVYGTVNDLSVCGAIPLYISLALIIEEGFDIETLCKIVKGIEESAKKANVQVVTGDTKVVEKGKGDGIFINTSGIGIISENIDIGYHRIEPGDKIILNGSIGEHGISVLSAREKLEFENIPLSDTAPLNHLIKKLFDEGLDIHFMRDPTRGGLSSSLNEIAKKSGFSIEIYEKEIPISEGVQGACEILGLDPFYVANEGKVLVFVKYRDAEKTIQIMKKDRLGKNSAIIGEVMSEKEKKVIIRTKIGARRILEVLQGEQLPRIC